MAFPRPIIFERFSPATTVFFDDQREKDKTRLAFAHPGDNLDQSSTVGFIVDRRPTVIKRDGQVGKTISSIVIAE